MTFKPATWFPIAVGLSVLNLVAVGYAAAGPAQPWHAGSHAALALAFGLWAQRLRLRQESARRAESERSTQIEAPEVLDALEGLESEVARLRQEMGEMQERLDFTERVLAKAPRQEPK
jgi:hypothetical protein